MAEYVRKFDCIVKNGKPVLDSPEGFMNECRPLEGKRATITIRPLKKVKSNQQQRYYRGVVVQRFAEYWVVTNEEAHRALSFEHLRIIPGDCSKPVYIRSTELTEWTTSEWEDYMSFLRRWGSEQFGLYIEEPNEVEYENIKTAF